MMSLDSQLQVPTPWGDRPHSQKVVGVMLPSRPHGNFVVTIVAYTAKMYSKISNVSLQKWKRCADFSLKMHQKHSSAFHPAL